MKRIKLKKRRNKLRIRRKLVVVSTLVLFLMLGIGYSLLSVNLNILGNITVKKHYGRTLYEVMEKEADIGTYAQEYTGEHHDSFTVEPSKKIYHWRARNADEGPVIKNKNNVIFANQCWQMFRTTDTGGVKLIYNGEPDNGQCLDTRAPQYGYHQETEQTLSTSFYYGTSYTYDKENDLFSLDGIKTTGEIKTGQYTCRQTASDGTCNILYLVDKIKDDSEYYVIPLRLMERYYQFGRIDFYNQLRYSPVYSGYMYNANYLVRNRTVGYFNVSNNVDYIKPTWYYSDTVDYGNIVPNQYTLINPQLVSSLSDISELEDKYILYSWGNGSEEKVRYVLKVTEYNTIVSTILQNGSFATSFMASDSYIDNNDGTYTLNNPTEIFFKDWRSNYQQYSNKYVCEAPNTTCSNIRHIKGNSSAYFYGLSSELTNYKYGEGVTYNNGVYTLTGDILSVWDLAASTEQEKLKTHHYTCLSNSTTCETVNYLIRAYDSNGYRIYFTELNNGKTIETALNEMLFDDDVNQNDSTIKVGIDAWYKKNILEYESLLEDTIFCNNRTIANLGAYNPNGGSVNGEYLRFQEYSSNNNLSCTNITDKFSVANNKAKLKYPIGLITSPEAYLNGSAAMATGNGYWTMSPSHFLPDFIYGHRQKIVSYQGDVGGDDVASVYGVRPVISLKPGIEYISGTGSKEDPYVV